MDELDQARSELARSAMARILGGVGELDCGGAILPEPIAKSFEALGRSLHAGADPMEIAAVCFAVAAALRSPDDAAEIERSAQQTVRDMQARKPDAGPE